MKIQHYPVTDTQRAIEYFTKKDGVPITYVCTTDLKSSDVPIDVFFRETPHPHFGNRYFGLFVHPLHQNTMICNADAVEDFLFGMVENDAGELEYSQSHHDYKIFENGNMIDGGREYIRSSNGCTIYIIRNGILQQQNHE